MFDLSAVKKAGYYPIEEATGGQPFPCGVCGCEQVRIPGLTVLQNGDLFATADARWQNAEDDFGGLDVLCSFSHDGGESWFSSYAALFPDSNGTPKNPNRVTTCIDSTPIQSADGTLHIFVNMNPSGITTGLNWPCVGTGFADVNGKRRLMLTDDYAYADLSPEEHPDQWGYYIGEYEDGFAAIIGTDGLMSGYAADEYFNLYRITENGFEPLTQPQCETGETVFQNIFYMDSRLHVFNTMYTLHLTSDDSGRSWHAELINSGIKSESESACIASPGNGLLAADGTLILPFYNMTKEGDSYSYLAFSEDNGRTWRRTPFVPVTNDIPWSGESKPVELPDGTIRLFFRNGIRRICYADYSRKENTWQTPVILPYLIHSTCNFAAAAIGNRIYASFPEGIGPEAKTRTHGQLFVFENDADNQMKLLEKIPITEGYFSYSVLTVLDEHTLGLLYDTCEHGKIFWKKIKIN